MLNEQQPRSDYFIANVPPLVKTNVKLPGGSPGQGPFFYSLGNQSTCPFVSLLGGGMTQKIFTWGEMIQVDEGQQVTVKNESFHQGDIQIVSGHDYANKPERITLPILITGISGPGGFIEPTFPADTRRCRKAYLYSQMLTTNLPGSGLSVIFSGRQINHSFNSLQDPGLPRGYNETVVVPPGTFVGQLPMGFGSGLIPNSPMALLDQVSFRVNFGVNPPSLGNSLFFYSLEY